MQQLEGLSTLVSKRFATAKEAGHVVFAPSQLAIIQASGISVSYFSFQI